MGYMGFGMKKEVYTRKPRVPFKKLKKHIKSELIHANNNNSAITESFTKEEITRAKRQIRERFRKRSIQLYTLYAFVFAFVILLGLYLILD